MRMLVSVKGEAEQAEFAQQICLSYTDICVICFCYWLAFY